MIMSTVMAFDQSLSRCCWLYFGCKFTYPNFLFKSKNWIPLSQYNLCLSEITGQLHHIKVDRWVCSVGAMPGPDIRPYQLRNRKNWGVMHCNLEQSVCCVLILVAGTFELWHCHYQTNLNSVFSRCDVRHALIWGATNPLIFGNVESLIKTEIFSDASFAYYYQKPFVLPKYSEQKIEMRQITAFIHQLSTSCSYLRFLFINCQFYHVWTEKYFSWASLVQERNELNWGFMQDILINHNGTSCLMVYLASVTSGMSWYGDLINTSAPPPWSRIQEVLSV